MDMFTYELQLHHCRSLNLGNLHFHKLAGNRLFTSSIQDLDKYLHWFTVIKYEQLLRFFNLKQIINDSTRVTEPTASIIDITLCSHENKVFQSGVVPIGVSDHFLIFFLY